MKNLDYKADFIYVDSFSKCPQYLTDFFNSHNIYSEKTKPEHPFYFYYSERLKLINRELNKEIYFDLNKEYFIQSQKKGHLSFGPLFKALGKENDLHVVDATCGTGKDAILLLSMGVNKVTAFERSPWVFPLLLDAWYRLTDEFSQLKDKLILHYGSADDISADLIYFDPMYPSKKKSALSRKEMEFFKTIVGNDDDSEKELERLRCFDVKKIIVKRPLKAKPLVNKPHYAVKGTTTRYDIYLKHSKTK